MRILLSVFALLLASCATEPTVAPVEAHPPVYAPAPPPPPAAPPAPAPAPPVAVAAPSPVYTDGGATTSGGTATASTGGSHGGSGKFGDSSWKFIEPKANAPMLAYKDLLPSSKKDNLKDTNPRSYVIFTHRPEKSDIDVYEAVCRHWTWDFETKESVTPYAAPNTVYIPFYWVSTAKSVNGHNCNAADLYAYDYGHASAIISAIGKEAQSVGPLLVLRNAQGWFVLDISKFTPVDVKRAFTIWKQQITRADLTQTKFTMVKMREYFRTLVEAYGDTILKSAEKAS